MAVSEIESFLLLTFLSLSYSTSLRRVERLRRAVALDRLPDMLGVWTFAAAMTLPPPLVAAFVIAANVGEWPSRKVFLGGRPGKYAVSTAGTASWCVLAGAVTHTVGGYLGAALGVGTFCALSVGFVAVLVCLSGKRAILRGMMGTPKPHVVEITTQSMGACVGAAMLWHPLTAVLALPCLYLLHLSSARHAVAVTHSFDSDSGLWSEEAWKVQAADLIAEGEYVILVLVDDDGSPERPSVTADVIRGCLRAGDPIGRYGESQIVAVSVVGVAVCGLAIADRIQGSLARAGANTAHGCRTARGEDLSEMLMVAGSNLMAERDRAATASRG